MTEYDSLQRFIFEHAPIRGQIVHLNRTFQEIIEQRNYPAAVRKMLGEALVSCLLLASSIKFEGSLTLQFQGSDAIPLLIVQTNDQLQVRAMAKYAEMLSDEEYQQAYLDGQLVLTLQQDSQTQNYQSLVPIQHRSMAQNLMEYFAQSEQISTKVWLTVGNDAAAGILLQLLPGKGREERENFWSYAVQLGQTVTDEELLHLGNHTLLHRLYDEEEVRVFDSRHTEFKCRCTPEKMQQALLVIGEQDATELLTEQQGKIDIRCDFCNKTYTFDAIDVALLFRRQKS